MTVRGVLLITVIIIGVATACAGMGWYAGRSGAQQLAAQPQTALTGTPISLQTGRRIRLYLGPDIQGEPAYTFVAGRVYRGRQLDQPFLTLEDKRVYSGGGVRGPLLYEFTHNRVVEAGPDGQVAFVQRDDAVHFGSDPQAPLLFTFEGTHVFWGSPSDGRVLATSNTVVNNPDLIKLVSIVLYMETLE